ncbi:TonB-dependent receptor [Qipengyuania algicida]|uniref:TonB-dependent receptor n=1 Tax=Qipengyuania algicida TaxID=1836209 RepID=UPI001F3B8909|nr:TonB-dependent receptor [Qipengyuania algicida]
MRSSFTLARLRLLTSTTLVLIAGGAIIAQPASAADAPAADASAATDSAQSRPVDNGIAEGSDIVVTATLANEIAPVTSSLETTQPQAIVSRSFIEDSLPATADFNQLALITPSFSTSGGNGGMGISESKGRLRGFQDGEYNITYDGVPFGDTNDPSHHSNTFFPSDTVETVVVDRGPGNASNLGQATFGGSVNLFSRATRADAGMTARAEYGSFNTFLGRAMVQSGKIDSLGGTEVLLGGQYVTTDGRLTYSGYHQTNLFGKAVIPIGPSVTLTLLSTYNKNHFNQPDNDGITLAQEAQYGKTFQLNNDPNSPQYFGYNYTDKTTDFEVATLEADIAPGSRLENRAYTYFYNNATISVADTTVPAGPDNATTNADGTKNIGHIPGYTKLNSYRTYGDILKGIFDLGPATLTVGGWIEWNVTHRKRYQYDMTDGGPDAMAYDYNQKTPVGVPKYINYDQDSRGNQEQVFAELELRPTSTIKITPGIKYIDFTRKLNAIANQKTHSPANFTASWSDTLPFLTVNWQPNDRLALYAQYAKGFLAPPLSVLYNYDPSNNTVQPETSTNYQLGFVFHGSHLSLDADVYKIDFNNKFASQKINGDTVFYNQGGVTYKGVEGQATYAFDNGLALFVNASRNFAEANDTGLQVKDAPYMTAAAGVLFHHGPVKASVIDKVTGAQYADDANTGAYRIPAYNTTIASLGYSFGRFGVQATVSDLFDSTAVNKIDINDGPPGDVMNSNDQYHFQPGREWSISLTAKI